MAQEARTPRRPAGRAGGGDEREVREAILDATRRLLDERRFDELSVADILAAAGVARGSFYFYFAGKHQVLAELTRRAVARGQEAAEPWLAGSADPRAGIRHGVGEGARLWREQAPVLRAIVENWRSDPELTELWLELMGGFTAATAARITADADAAPQVAAVDTDALAAALTWLGERLYYLAALEVSPFADEKTLVDVLTHIWMSVLYGGGKGGQGGDGKGGQGGDGGGSGGSAPAGPRRPADSAESADPADSAGSADPAA